VNHQRGFTLLELLVAMAILAIIGVMALGGLNTLLDQQAIANIQADRWNKVQFTMRMLTQDLSQLHPRGIRDAAGTGMRPSIEADPGSAYPLEFSRGGWNNPAGLPRGTVQRVAYEIEDDKLFRLHWPVLDPTMSSPPIRNELLDGIESIDLRFLDEGGQWHPDWPPTGVQAAQALSLRPRAVEVGITLEDMGKVWRLVEVSG
jgi:general secretion pathway protein J